MNLATLGIMIHCGHSPAPVPRVDNDPSVRDRITELIRSGLIEQRPSEMNCYSATPKGRVFLQMLQDTPLPVQSWEDPRKAK